ncbi:efflux RND transporter periplasmic adaptor subunit [Ideonella azotifigens]|uniref:Efflux RND transporter periplasmic adaptor subunit n=2 Tax=Ideonella azotifigens TaxID=513160 RepID=A0ABN1JWD6_9BURK|nr:efflux RND transporter periplasmic adaptor subunit [Ideonella azotifigens]MCD2343167.1 efflux RND transporter periplasmic adaptor subunit [Ideonella azotifigens]
MRTETTRSPRLRLVSLTAVALAVVVVATGLWTRKSRAEQLREGITASAVPTVTLISPAALASTRLELPARIEAWARAPIYARVSGYLKNWQVDIGGPVKAGQLLAEIETPDLDQQLMQARAELAAARSNAALAASTAQRWQTLLATDSVSRQEADERAGDMAAKQSAANAMQANVDRVQALQRYTRLVAPFDGVVTARNTDIGALIGVGGAPGSELFVVSDVRKLRVYVSVPQRQIAALRPGTQAVLTVPERPGQRYVATVASLAQSINGSTGAMLVQLTVDNAKGELLPGGFASVSLDNAPGTGGIGVPPGALIIGKAGVQVATVGQDNRVKLKQVDVARDLGSVVELASVPAGGLAAADRVIASPPDGIQDGDTVRVLAEPKKGA